MKDGRVAERALTKVQSEIGEGRVGVVRRKNPPLTEWADEFERITQRRVDAGDLKRRTLEA
jgi:hypothetical protein